MDGAGKSTQIALLRSYLEARGRRCATLWYRPSYSDMLVALRRGFRLLRPTRELSRRAPETCKVKHRGYVWAAGALTDSVIQFAVKVRGLLASGTTILCDRYISDAIIDLRLWFPKTPFGNDLAESLLETLSPRPDADFLLMLPWGVMLSRLAEKAEPFPDSPDVREQRFDAYKSLAQHGHHVVVDATLAQARVQEQIQSLVAKLERKHGR